MHDDDLLKVLNEAADAITAVLGPLEDWGLAGTRAGQYRSDLAADSVAIAVLTDAGLGVLSEESGVHHGKRPLLVALDPVDGSTNASHRLPWYATSLCALDPEGARAAVVVNQSSGVRYEAVRGAGATRDGNTITPSRCTELPMALVGLSGLPPRNFGWGQFRALGAAALDLCSVADGLLDAYVDCSPHAHAPWDYLGALLVCQESGAVVVDAHGRDLITRGWTDRRTPVAAGTPELLAELVAARSTFD